MEARIQQMYRDITRVYGRLATRSVRKPRSPVWAQLLPKGIFLADFPVPKGEKQLLRDVIVNDGLHVHGIVVANRWGRIDQPLDIHFSKNQEAYLLGVFAILMCSAFMKHRDMLPNMRSRRSSAGELQATTSSFSRAI